MYAVLKSVGKQFKVSPGDIMKIDKIEGNVGDTVSFKDIVAVGNGDKFEFGSPAVKGAEVSAKLLHQTRDDKIRVFRKNRRKHFQRTKGHRQYISILKVMSIKSLTNSPISKSILVSPSMISFSIVYFKSLAVLDPDVPEYTYNCNTAVLKLIILF